MQHLFSSSLVCRAVRLKHSLCILTFLKLGCLFSNQCIFNMVQYSDITYLIVSKAREETVLRRDRPSALGGI